MVTSKHKSKQNTKLEKTKLEKNESKQLTDETVNKNKKVGGKLTSNKVKVAGTEWPIEDISCGGGGGGGGGEIGESLQPHQQQQQQLPHAKRNNLVFQIIH